MSALDILKVFGGLDREGEFLAEDLVKERDQCAVVDGRDLREVLPDGLCFEVSVDCIFGKPALEIALKVIGAQEEREGGGFHQADKDIGGLLECGLLIALLCCAEVGLGWRALGVLCGGCGGRLVCVGCSCGCGGRLVCVGCSCGCVGCLAKVCWCVDGSELGGCFVRAGGCCGGGFFDGPRERKAPKAADVGVKSFHFAVEAFAECGFERVQVDSLDVDHLG